MQLLRQPTMARTSLPELPGLSGHLLFHQATAAPLPVTGLQLSLPFPEPLSCPSCPQRPQLSQERPAEPHGLLRPQPQSGSELRGAGGFEPRLQHGLSRLHHLAAGERGHRQRPFGRSESTTAAAPASPREEASVRRGAFVQNSISIDEWLLQPPQRELFEHPLP